MRTPRAYDIILGAVIVGFVLSSFAALIAVVTLVASLAGCSQSLVCSFKQTHGNPPHLIYAPTYTYGVNEPSTETPAYGSYAPAGTLWPPSPTGFRATLIDDETVELTWDPYPCPLHDHCSILVFKQNADPSWKFFDFEVIGDFDAKANSFEDTWVTPGQTYVYAVAARVWKNAADYPISSLSNQVTVVIIF